MSPTSASWGVLDSNLLVKKVSGLRVVDASAFVRHLSSPKSLIDVVFSPPFQNVILKPSFIHSPKEQRLLSKNHGRKIIVTSISNFMMRLTSTRQYSRKLWKTAQFYMVIDMDDQ